MSHYDASLIDRHAYADSAVHRLDPRAKVLATLVFILAVVSYPKHAVAPLVPFVIFPAGMAIMGFVPLGTMAKRVMIALPFIVVIGIFNPLLDRTPGFELFGISITSGWISFASILARGLLCVSAAVVLAATTSFPRITQALRALGVPRVLVVQLLLLYRYLFLLVGEAQRMNRARLLRSGAARNPLKVAVSMLSVLLIRTLDRADVVWLAMKARGFDGDLKTAIRMEWMARDTAFLVLVAGGCVLLRVFPVTETLGRMWLG